MSEKRCPSPNELVSFVDLDLSPENLARVDSHASGCAVCAQQIAALRELIADVAAPVPAPSLDVAAHVASVLERLDVAVPSSKASPSGRRIAAWSGGLALAAAACFALFVGRPEVPSDEFVARGGPSEASLSRDVGVQLYTQTTSVQPLRSGARIRANAALTAGLRNLGRNDAYLLLFAVDSQQAVHWVAPEYTVLGVDPVATPIVPAADERLLPSSVVFGDLSPGPLRIFAVITHEATRVSQVETLKASELNAEGLLARFPNAEVRQFMLEVSP